MPVGILISDIPGALSAGEQALINRLELTLGWDTTDVRDDGDTHNQTTDEANFDAVFIGSQVSNTSVANDFETYTIGVFLMKGNLSDEHGVSSHGGASSARTDIDIEDNTHEITTGFSLGVTTVYSASGTMQHSIYSDSVGDILANDDTATDRGRLVAIETGTAHYDATANMAGRRVMFFWSCGHGDTLNATGWTLFDRSVAFLTPVTDINQPINPAVETDEAIANAGVGKQQAISPALETDTSEPSAAAKAKAITPVTETDETGLVETPWIFQPITHAEESASAIAFTSTKSKSVLPAEETDQAILLTTPGTINQAISPAVEASETVGVGAGKDRLISPATEADSAVLVHTQQYVPISPALETDSPIVLGRGKSRAIASVSDSSEAVAIAGTSIEKPISPAIEFDEAVRNVDAGVDDYYPMIGSLGIWILAQYITDYALQGSSKFEEF